MSAAVVVAGLPAPAFVSTESVAPAAQVTQSTFVAASPAVAGSTLTFGRCIYLTA